MGFSRAEKNAISTLAIMLFSFDGISEAVINFLFKP
jgi:hypothetical protein